MKGILINVFNETVQQVEIDNDNTLQSWYKHLNCQMVQVCHYFNDKDSIMCDEEGLYNVTDDSKFFTVVGGHQPFIGNGLVVGVNPNNGESVDPHITVEEVRTKIKFHTLKEVRSMNLQ